MECKPEFHVGDKLIFDVGTWCVKSNNGFMLSANNVNKESKRSGISWIGNIESNDYKKI